MLCSLGQDQADWTAAYRLFSRERISADGLLESVQETLLQNLPAGAPLVTALDDTLLPKTGKKIIDTSWYRDPLGPPFQTNLIWAQRLLQITGAWPASEGIGPARMIPVVVRDARKPRKPARRASPEDQVAYQCARKARTLGKIAAAAVEQLRASLDRGEHRNRDLRVAVDGGYANKTLLRHLPERTTAIARIRRDARLFQAPSPHSGAGKPRFYGARLQTPEQMRQDEQIPWEEVSAFVAGARHLFRVKVLRNLRSALTGNRPVAVMIIAPLHYRTPGNTRLYYKNPAYLLSTQDDLPVQEMLQNYLWRWDIEQVHRDEKQTLGVGQPQVRSPRSITETPRWQIATYAALLAAAAMRWGPATRPDFLPLPKWRRKKPARRATAGDIVSQLRQELWGIALDRNKTDFASQTRLYTNRPKLLPDLVSSVRYAANCA